MGSLMPSPLREVLTIRLRLYEDGTVMVAAESGPDPTTSTFRSCRSFDGPGALSAASLWSADISALWTAAGTLGLASEVDG